MATPDNFRALSVDEHDAARGDRRRSIETRHAWAIVTATGWFVPCDYFVSPPAIKRDRSGMRTLLFATRREARRFLPRARRTLPKPRPVRVTVTVSA